MDSRVNPHNRDTVKVASHMPAANTPAIVTLSAASGTRHVIDSILFSYSAAPTGGAITIQIGSTTHGPHAVTQSGPGVIPIQSGNDGGLAGANNEAIIVTLAAGGGSVVGSLTVLYR